MKFQILGYKKTKEKFLNKISRISSDMSSLKDKLNQLNIFSSVTENKKKITVYENTRKISINSKGKDQNEININFPNIFGKGENFNVNMRSLKEYEVNFTKPFIFNNFLFFADFNTKRSIRRLFDKEHVLSNKEMGIRNKYVDFGYGLDKYVFLRFNQDNIKFNILQGLDYAKITASLNFDFFLCKNIQHKVILSTGSALGNISDINKFYIGENIKGYKKDSIIPNMNEGGRSFLEFTNKMIFNVKNMDFYIFDSIGLNHSGINILDFKCKSEERFPGSMGHSLGVGLNIPLYEKINGPNIDISLAWPMIKDRDLESYQFSFDINF
ncbi:SAM50-like protein [Vairimorpha necatrix]|uniref:SAM50-like protein n=1 Tax=Vairimorpha necatrix TaxID=6039 RepID=A0AAX4JA94_9MICR